MTQPRGLSGRAPPYGGCIDIGRAPMPALDWGAAPTRNHSRCAGAGDCESRRASMSGNSPTCISLRQQREVRTAIRPFISRRGSSRASAPPKGLASTDIMDRP